MDSIMPKAEELTNLAIDSLGKAKIFSPLKKERSLYIDDSSRIIVYSDSSNTNLYLNKNETLPMFEAAGPREHIFFDPSKLTCGIVTCGGLCPGLNDVVRSVTLSLIWQYGVRKVLGFRYGFQGLSSKPQIKPIELTSDVVDEMQHQGGSILGTSRGKQDSGEMVDTLLKYQIGILFVIGGDGSFRGAYDIVQEIKKRSLPISVIAIPKTIDDDIYCTEMTFGLSTAVEVARDAIYAAHEEAKAVLNGVGIVRLMGRDSGFITAYASLANSDVNFCFIPEVSFQFDGERGLLRVLERRLNRKHHAVIVVAQGAGQNLIDSKEPIETDASGNVRYKDIGLFFKKRIEQYFSKKTIPVAIKYIDPSYTIRGCPANSFDSAFCIILGQLAVHAGMAGKTNMFVSHWNNNFVHVPLPLAIHKRKQIDPQGTLWQTIVDTTEKIGQEEL